MSTWRDVDSLSERLRVVLEARGLTQSDLAKKSGLSTSYVSMLIRGERGSRIGRGAAASLRRVLKVPDTFFDGSSYAYEESSE